MNPSAWKAPRSIRQPRRLPRHHLPAALAAGVHVGVTQAEGVELAVRPGGGFHLARHDGQVRAVEAHRVAADFGALVHLPARCDGFDERRLAVLQAVGVGVHQIVGEDVAQRAGVFGLLGLEPPLFELANGVGGALGQGTEAEEEQGEEDFHGEV